LVFGIILIIRLSVERVFGNNLRVSKNPPQVYLKTLPKNFL
jgi:hypothetical protein